MRRTPGYSSRLLLRRQGATDGAARAGSTSCADPRAVGSRWRGQSALIVALASIALIAVVGLAIDGGSMYNQRRVAQNGADGAAMAGARQMLVFFEDMALHTTADDDNYPTAAQANINEDAVRAKIDEYATSNGVLASTLKAYFVDDSKNIVTVNNGDEHGGGHCGAGGYNNPCQVGQNGVIPWQEGAKGIWIQKAEAQTDSFFVRILGWSKVGASATATAYLGVSITASYDVKLLPIGFYTTTEALNRLQIGNIYTLIASDTVTDDIGSGNWGWVNFKGGSPNTSVLRAWLACGFNPMVTADTWPDWCPSNPNVTGAEGPLVYWTGWPPDGIDITGSYEGVTLRFGDGNDGWWVSGTTGTKSAACQRFRDISVGQEYIVPIFDASNNATGSGLLYHLVRLGKFLITTGNVQCNAVNGKWNIQGRFEAYYAIGSSGWHGDLRRFSLHVIFLAP